MHDPGSVIECMTQRLSIIMVGNVIDCAHELKNIDPSWINEWQALLHS